MANATLPGPANGDAKLPGCNSDHDYYNLTKSERSTGNNELAYANLQSLRGVVASSANQRSSGTQMSAPQDIQTNEQERKDSEMLATLENTRVSSHDSPWVKMSCDSDEHHIDNDTQHPSFQQEQVKETVLADAKLTEPAEKQGNTEDIWLTDSSYWTLSPTKQESHRESRTILSKNKENSLETDDSTTYSDFKQVRSPEKPVLPKKPDLCILGLMASPEAKRGPGGLKNTSPSSGLNNQSQPPPDSSCTGLHAHVTHGTSSPKHLTCTATDKTLTHTTSPADVTTNSPVSSPQRQKPPILYKKPDLSLTSPKTTKPSKNTGESSKGTPGTW
ncbi:NHS-like protein 1 [Lates japonicus]|uniref:NHS-like protein 1 n=1 Tax=Lates japonicus TaxID=270547 RepID=A0AAD3NNL6_LATJO|nr:NHS-like protein 1 [Lates japonicus]